MIILIYKCQYHVYFNICNLILFIKHHVFWLLNSIDDKETKVNQLLILCIAIIINLFSPPHFTFVYFIYCHLHYEIEFNIIILVIAIIINLDIVIINSLFIAIIINFNYLYQILISKYLLLLSKAHNTIPFNYLIKFHLLI